MEEKRITLKTKKSSIKYSHKKAQRRVPTQEEWGKVLSEISADDISLIVNAVSNEFKEFKTDAEKIKYIASTYGEKYDVVEKWRNANDIITHYNISKLATKNPEAAKVMTSKALAILGLYYKPAIIIKSIVDQVPAELIGAITSAATSLSVTNILNLITERKVKNNDKMIGEYEKKILTSDGIRNLTVVCQNDDLFNQIKSLVEVDDDENGAVIGVKDGSVFVNRWKNSQWKKCFNKMKLKNKILIVGDAYASENISSKIKYRLNAYGVTFGWAGNFACLSVDKNYFKTHEGYDEFQKELQTLFIPDKKKKNYKKKTTTKEVVKYIVLPPMAIKSIFDSSKISEQQYYYGIAKVYLEYLEDFLSI